MAFEISSIHICSTTHCLDVIYYHLLSNDSIEGFPLYLVVIISVYHCYYSAIDVRSIGTVCTHIVFFLSFCSIVDSLLSCHSVCLFGFCIWLIFQGKSLLIFAPLLLKRQINIICWHGQYLSWPMAIKWFIGMKSMFLFGHAMNQFFDCKIIEYLPHQRISLDDSLIFAIMR